MDQIRSMKKFNHNLAQNMFGTSVSYDEFVSMQLIPDNYTMR